MVKNFNKKLFSFSDGIYRTKEKLVYHIKVRGKMIRVEVEKNFGWNGVTGFFTNLKTLVPSLVHDWLIFDEKINGSKRFTREEMDEIYIIMCKVNKVSKFVLTIFRIGLKINRML